ncbi:restriction endonuclease subunit S [Fructobacillus tropaeoli]|uniref:Restriction endonuclease S subunit (HsdS) n=1 Tax=Fructobacillus tropaeoli TaxID=709323 RepID=A0ABM9MUQ0_9LACO|nr:Restriction endonuclease S subunit (HsdS) [Fructobacillus tropaeoli]
MVDRVPDIRFKGFTDAWVQRKAKDLFIPVNERNREDLPVLSVTQDQGVVFRKDLAIDIKYDESTLSSYKVIHPGDFVISLRSFQGGFELSNVLGISSPAYTIFNFAVPAEQDKLYWKTILKTFKFIESLKTVTFGIRDGKSISFKEFGDLKLNYPSDVDEQRRIGEFFAKLDETIALHQRKLDLLKEQKKGYLQKMFPKNGKKVPELRFAGFADDWEQRKVRELFTVTRGQVLAVSEVSSIKTLVNPYPVYSSQTKNNGLLGYYHDYLFDGGITWTTDGANAGTVKYRNGKFYSTNVNGVLLSNDGYMNKSIAEILNKSAWKYVSHVGNPKLMNNVMSDIKIEIPTKISEQKNLSGLIDKIDNLITLHQRKLELLKEQKKGFLQKMFV